jgi:hypothetical protein
MLAGAVDQPPPGSQYAGGLDRVRTDGTKPRGFHWLTRPMLVSMLGLAILAGFGIPTINAYQPPVAGPLLTFIRSAAEPHEQHVTVSGRAATLEDPTGDQSGEVLLATDIVTADYAFMPVVPAWLLGEVLNCMSLTVVCASSRGDLFSFSQGAMVFLQRMVAAPEGLPSGRSGEWGPMLAWAGKYAAPLTPRTVYPGANLAVINSSGMGPTTSGCSSTTGGGSSRSSRTPVHGGSALICSPSCRSARRSRCRSDGTPTPRSPIAGHRADAAIGCASTS